MTLYCPTCERPYDEERAREIHRETLRGLACLPVGTGRGGNGFCEPRLQPRTVADLHALGFASWLDIWQGDESELTGAWGVGPSTARELKRAADDAYYSIRNWSAWDEDDLIASEMRELGAAS